VTRGAAVAIEVIDELLRRLRLLRWLLTPRWPTR